MAETTPQNYANHTRWDPPFHFFAMAFGWHGDALAWMAGKAALRYFKGDARREDDVFSFARYL